jgi:prepilin-type N-terminal cleavage/methylation domain-containing protein
MQFFHKQNKKKGFTLVEIIVAMAIFAFIAASIFAGNSNFNSGVLLTNLAYEVALTIRQAQVFGLSVRESVTSGFDLGYGVHFNTNNQVNYIFFADINDDGYYTPPNESIESFTLRRGNKIGSFCVYNVASSKVCSDTVNTLDITYKRPNPDAIIKVDNAIYKTAEIYIESPKGNRRMVRVDESGQISIETDVD